MNVVNAKQGRLRAADLKPTPTFKSLLSKKREFQYHIQVYSSSYNA